MDLLYTQAWRLRVKLRRSEGKEAEDLQAELDAVESALLWEEGIVTPLRDIRSFIAARLAQLEAAAAGLRPVGKEKNE